MPKNTDHPRQHWLLLGTIYGPMIGHTLGKVVVGARHKVRDDTLDVFWYAFYGLLIGLALGLIADVLAQCGRRSVGPSNTDAFARAHSFLWLLLPVAVVLYGLLLPAFNAAR